MKAMTISTLQQAHNEIVKLNEHLQERTKEYQQAIARIMEIEDMLEMKVSLAHAQNVDLGNQLSATFALLAEARDLLVITALESPLRKNIMELTERIDRFYPRGA